MRKIVSYDERNDIFFIHNGFLKGEKFYGNEMIGDLVLDVSTKRRIVGIEILNATRYLKPFGITEEILTALTDAHLEATLTHDSATLSLILQTKNKEIPVKIAVALETPIPVF